MEFILSVLRKFGVNLVQVRKPWVSSYPLSASSRLTVLISVSDDGEFIGNVVLKKKVSRSVVNTSVYTMTAHCTADNLFTWFDYSCEQLGVIPFEGNEKVHTILNRYFDEYKRTTQLDEQQVLIA